MKSCTSRVNGFNRYKVMAMRTSCAGFIWTSMMARLSRLDKNTDTPARFTRISRKNQIPETLIVFSWHLTPLV